MSKKTNRLWISDYDKVRTKCVKELFGGESFGIYDNFPIDRKEKIMKSDEIICFEDKHADYILKFYPKHINKIKLILGIPNDYKEINHTLKVCIKSMYLHGTFLNLKDKYRDELNERNQE